MKPVTILLAAAALAASVVTARAEWIRKPDGSLFCPGSYVVHRLNGEPVIVCPPAPISQRQADDYQREWQRNHDANEAAARSRALDSAARERESIRATCAKPDPSINQAWCANELARVSRPAPR